MAPIFSCAKSDVFLLEKRKTTIAYESPSRMGAVWFDRGIMAYRGYVYGAQQSVSYTYDTGYPIRDCSDEKYTCLSSWFRVFAVPKGNIEVGMSYEIAGAKLKVENCEMDCKVALISSNCQGMVGNEYCGLDNALNVEKGPITYFLYHEKFGILSFGVGNGQPQNKSDELKNAEAVSRQFILKNESGLLKSSIKPYQYCPDKPSSLCESTK